MTEEKKIKGNFPNLRFPEFEGEWEEIRLDDSCDKIGDGIHSTPKYDDTGDYFFINGNNFVKGKIIISESTKRITKTEAEKYNAHTLVENTILISINGTIGNLALYNGEPVMLGKSACYINPQKTQNRLFTFYQLSTNRISNYFTSELTGSTIKNLSLKSIRNTILYSPVSEEQEEIGEFLSLIDQRIETQSKIIEDLKLLKSTIGEKLFNKELYIKKISNWKMTRLSHVLTIPERIKPTYIDKNKLLTVKLHLKGVAKNDNTETLSIGATNYYIRKKSQFIYGKQNLFNGAFAIIPDELDGYLSSGDVPSLDVDETKINPLYLMYYLGREYIYKQIEKLAIGSGSKRVHESTLLNLEIPLSTIEEQSYIVKPLYTLDRKITIEEKMLSCLLKEKAYFLREMFI
ncbi:type I restriction enzyme S subunit [Dysgonomonas sp. PF1-14]|uniref:restriction endonuclease subunit S n=2 Tax=Dysgonomonas TaxID=156973 RepID=UPI002473DD95|nr:MULTISPECIES: restriction endonuclease subunit S [unclassified Dysgonomonas]MDH6310722.1 type I restriction enzyme S subunit [Dysgonomonas sp. PF1-14]MDH6340572.1 type I restriction enzyme S subunit [Dysgonomonas sp. PF1-16]MDH6399515.1 type I restriction enzyme S subunit [Dysgonomonas sp. PF1-23]